MISTSLPHGSTCASTQEHLSGWNGLLWNDYMNCDSFAAEAILQAERDELAYIDAQCAQALKNAYPALAEPVRVFGGSSKGVAIHVIPLLNEGENTEQPKDPKKEDQKVITGEGEQKRSKTPEPQEDSFPESDIPSLAEYCAGDGWIQDTSSEPQKTLFEEAVRVCADCKAQHQECHCRKDELRREAQQPAEATRLNLGPRRKSIERHAPVELDFW